MKIKNSCVSIITALCLIIPIFSFASDENQNTDYNEPMLSIKEGSTKLSFEQIVQQMRDELQEFTHFDPTSYLTLYIPFSSNSEPKYQPLYNVPDAQVAQSRVFDYFKNKGFLQRIEGSSSRIDFPDFPLFLSEVIYNNRDSFTEPVMTIKSVQLQDGTLVAVNQKILPRGYVMVDSNKRIIAVNIELSYVVPKTAITKLVFSQNSEQVQDNISLDSILNNTVTFSLPKRAENSLLYVEGLDEEGRALVNLSNSSYSFDLGQINHVKAFYQQVLSDIDAGKITDKASLITYVKQSYTPLGEEQIRQSKQLILRYYFKGTVNSVNVYLVQETQTIHQQLILSKLRDEYNDGLTVGMNDGEYGIINEQGQWVIEPKYEQITHEAGNYYNIYHDGNADLYLLDSKTKQLDKQPFFMMSSKIYQDQYVIVNRDPSNNLIEGLLDINHNRLVLPVNYTQITIHPYFYVADLSSQDDKESVRIIYNINNHKKLLTSNENIIIDNQNFIALNVVCTKESTDDTDYLSGKSYSGGNYCYNQYYLYDVNGKKLNKKAYREVIGRYSKNNSLLVLNDNRKLQFINRQGQNLNINLAAYQEVKPFSQGLAAVQCRSNKLYGYINNKSKLVIPCIYNSAYYFQAGTALVEKNKQYQLINAKNELVKQLEGRLNKGIYSTAIAQDNADPVYSFSNSRFSDVQYNSKGEEVN